MEVATWRHSPVLLTEGFKKPATAGLFLGSPGDSQETSEKKFLLGATAGSHFVIADS